MLDFHPVIQRWFQSRYAGPTEPQQHGWPPIAAGQHTLIAAPTGSGKTLTAFLACIDRLFRRGLAGELADRISVVYVSPLRALSNDMQRNLETPLAEIAAMALEMQHAWPGLRVGLRTGDTPARDRAAMLRKPPHILVTTPESLYLLLTAEKGRETLRHVETVIVDEIHALARDKRGSHLSLTLERLQALVEQPLQRIGLSATQRPIQRMAEFLIGARRCEDGSLPVEIVDVGHSRVLDLAIETPDSELGAVCTHEQWEEVNARVIELIHQHRSTLIFVNTRRMAERVTHQLTELLGEGVVSSHHGSLAAKLRLDTEQRLKSGELKAVVATASLELGLDVGYIDLVIQLGSPRSIATFLQRIGRSGHALGLIPKGRLFALSRDELLECMALVRAVRSGRLDPTPIPVGPLDVLAQQIVAEVAAQDWDSQELLACFRWAYPYQQLSQTDFEKTVEFLSEGITNSSGRGRVYLHRDQEQGKLRARRGARIAAISNGGAIPDLASYRVVSDPDGTVVGSVDEEFAVESQRGEVFLLGNTSWRILHVRGGDVTVADAHGAPPTIPFWQGEAPGRTLELSTVLSELRAAIATHLGDPQAADWLVQETSASQAAAAQIVAYCAAEQGAIGLLPTQQRVVFERFFDESGGMQLVVHAPFGGAINRAWGLAMRKRFCRSFDFELQATADDDGFILSLGPQHSFPISSLFNMLNPENARGLLEQAILTIPMFQVRWRWNATRSLLVLRSRNGQKVPSPLQRFRADDLLTAVFPKLTGCQENVVGDLEVPDHPLARQTMHDCLHEPLDLPGLLNTLRQVQQGEIEFVARDTREPSPFCYELLNSNPYAFLDGGEAQERRARAVSTRRSLTVESVQDLGRLDSEAIRQVCDEAQPLVRSADELHDALLSRIILPVEESAEWEPFFAELAEGRRAARLTLPSGRLAYVAAERLPAALAAFAEAACQPALVVPASVRQDWTALEARLAMVRGLLETCGPITGSSLAVRLELTLDQADATLEALEGEGLVLRGHFSPPNETLLSSCTGQPELEWCHRRLLARIHRLTLAGLRRQIEPVGVETYLRYLFRLHGLQGAGRRSGSNGIFEAVSLLQGLDLPAICWERDLLPARVEQFEPAQLDRLCLEGEVAWGRLYPRGAPKGKSLANLTRVAPISLFLREDLPWLTAWKPAAEDLLPTGLSGSAEAMLEVLGKQGALFAADLMRETGLLPSQLDDVLGELITRGQVTADSFAGLRQLIAEKNQQRRTQRRSRPGLLRRRRVSGGTGRWSLWRRNQVPAEEQPPGERTELVEQWAWQLLRRWGVMFRDLLERETGAPSWFELLQVYRRLEARGEIRGGRFIAGVAGEQFAVGDTVSQLRKLRDAGPQHELIVISAADPLNLVGILTKQPRVMSIATGRVAYLDGVPAACLQAGEMSSFMPLSAELERTLTEKFGLRGSALPRRELMNAILPGDVSPEVPLPGKAEPETLF